MTTVKPDTIPQLLKDSVSKDPEREAVASIHDGKLQWRTWQELEAAVIRMRDTLCDLDVNPGDRVAQVSANRYEWIVADLAILSLGAVHVPIHVSLAPEQIHYQITDSGAQLVFLSNETRTKLQGQLDPGLTVLCHDDPLREVANSEREFLAPSGDSLATLMYTSGTTGKPQGVMLSHRNLTSTAMGVTQAVGEGPNEVRVCFLPFSHIYARTCELYTWLFRGSKLVLAENRETILRDCQLTKPTMINGVPYFYQKVAHQLHGAESGTLQKSLGGRLKRCFCGGAAVPPEVEAFFEQQGLPLLSGYGLTEASPVVTASSYDNYEAGSVGRPIAECEVQIAEDGEICVRGPNVMSGYWNDEKATEHALQGDWLHTGDLGEWTSSGNLSIVGRKKETLVLSTGKNIMPSRVEQLLVGSPYVESVCVVGDGQKCLAALIVPNPEKLRAKIRELRLWVWSRRRAVTHPKIHRFYRQELDRVLAGASSEEQIGPFAILDRNFSIEAGEMTAKLSLCRSVISSSFGPLIARLYR